MKLLAYKQDGLFFLGGYECNIPFHLLTGKRNRKHHVQCVVAGGAGRVGQLMSSILTDSHSEKIYTVSLVIGLASGGKTARGFRMKWGC